jgi:hypothetical protein
MKLVHVLRKFRGYFEVFTMKPYNKEVSAWTGETKHHASDVFESITQEFPDLTPPVEPR